MVKDIPLPSNPKQTQWTLEQSCISGNKSPEGVKTLEAMKRLVESEGREIDPLLIRGFNQNGRWAFIDKLEFLNPPSHLHNFIANFTLPRDKRCLNIKGKTHLLTNYITAEEKEVLNIPYHSIGGCLIVKNSFYIKATHLEKVNGRVQLERAKSLKAPCLKEINGDLNIRMAHLIHMPKLTKVNGELDIFYARSADLTDLKEIESIKVAHLKAEEQETIIKNLSLQSLEGILKSTVMSPSIHTQQLREFIEKETKVKQLAKKITSNKESQTLTL
jgi:hypothetical protein